MSTEILSACARAIAPAVDAIQQPRTNFELQRFVIGQHDTEPRRYAQCVLELQIKIQGLRRAQIVRRQLVRRIQRLETKNTQTSNDAAALLRLDLEDHDHACLGATRELEALQFVFKSFPRQYTREELNEAEAEYWRARLLRQATQDLAATGRIGVGNQEALRQIGLPAGPSPEYVSAVERRFLQNGDLKLVVIVPTLISRESIAADGLRCLNGWSVPGTIRSVIHVVDGRPVAAAYTAGVEWALSQGADFILCVEDDHLIPADAFDRLWNLYHSEGPRAVIGAWYPQKRRPRTGAPIVLRDGRREYLSDDGETHEVYVIPQGFTLVPARLFIELPQPWFATTECLTQDAFFSQLAREAGYRLLVDTAIRCQHVDRNTGEVFE